MKKINKVITVFSAFVMMLSCHTVKINAGGIGASASTGSVAVGGSFNVTVSSSGMMVEGLSVSCSGCTITSGLGRSTLDSGESQTVSAVLNSATGATVTFSGNGANYDTETEGPVATSASVAAIAPAAPAAPSGGGSGATPAPGTPAVEPQDDPRSKNNDLASLTIDLGTLTPAFAKETTEYSVSLPSTAKSIKVDAAAEDAKATVTGTGDIKLEAGDNEINVVVKSEYGTEKAYKIKVNVDEKPLQYVTYNGKKLGVVRNVKTATPPAGFKETTIKLDGKEIPAWKNDTIKKTIVYLSDDKNNKNFYIYEGGKISTVFISKQILGKDVYIIDVPENLQKRTGMKFEKIKIDNNEMMGWTFTDKALKNYKIIYVMDMDGKTRYYQYEEEQKTLQIYPNVAQVSQEDYDKVSGEKQTWMYTAIGFIVVSIAVAAYGVFITLKKKKQD